jgi:hypothetical protein
MSKQDNLKKAKQIIQNIVMGQHPYTGEKIKPTEVCADERVIQWLNFIEEELDLSISRLEKSRERFLETATYTTFKINKTSLGNFVYSDSPITISEIAKRLNDISDCSPLDELKPVNLNCWLINDGVLVEEDTAYGKMKVPTEKGRKLGVSSAERSFQDKTYISVSYNKDAQRYIISRIVDYLQKYATQNIASGVATAG